MSEVSKATSAKVVHVIQTAPLSPEQASLRDVELKIAGHFREQNEILHSNNAQLRDQLQRLTNGVERLVTEMHGVRTGEKDEAFARVAGIDASPDLPTVSAEAALLYTETSKSIGAALGFHASQIGQLLGPAGLGWVGKSEFQELGRKCSQNQTKFWHREVPSRLRVILDANQPHELGVTSPGALSIFRRWQLRKH